MHKNNHAKYIIIGAGLSGLTSAYLLHQWGISDVLVLESRDRIGGRIFTKNHIDFGATWFQDHHQTLTQLLDELEINKFPQYGEGKNVLVYNTMAPAHYFESDSSSTAFRIEGGSTSLIEKLALPTTIVTSTTVTHLRNKADDTVEITTDKGIYTAEKVIITIPPKIATEITYTPSLPDTLITKMKSIHTWMSNAIKLGITYEKPFWREKGFSGTVIGQVGALTELYDHSDANGTSFSLMGFINEGLRDSTPQQRKEKILSYLQTYLGEEVHHYLTYEEKDWAMDEHTSGSEIKSIYMSPQYGDPAFASWHMEQKVLFSGTETSPVYGGYMDGAVYSGIMAAKKIMTDVEK